MYSLIGVFLILFFLRDKRKVLKEGTEQGLSKQQLEPYISNAHGMMFCGSILVIIDIVSFFN